MLDLPRIRPLSEEKDIDSVIEAAGGRRAHPDWDHRDLRNSDYSLGQSIIELKLIEDERLEKLQAQEKIAELFGAFDPDRPVVVIDPEVLNDAQRREYATIMRAPIKSAVRSASGQLKQTRREIDPNATNVLFVVNNGFSTMSHDELLEHVVGRVKNDTEEIDAVVVGGCYLHGDGFDIFALWPIDCVTIYKERPFREFAALQRSWNQLADRHMTEFVRGEHGKMASKEAQTDTVFNWNGRTYVKPTVRIGVSSQFFGERRPRRNHIPFDQVKNVAITIPRLSPVEYKRVRSALKDEPLLDSIEAWNTHLAEAMETSTSDKPVVAIDMSRGSWEAWRRRNPTITGTMSFRLAANAVFGARVSKLVYAARKIDRTEKLPSRYIWVVVELIGQDEENDIAHIGYVIDGDKNILAKNLRKGHNEALALAAAHAMRMGLSDILWHHNLTYAWV
ncbi:hypothetical protein [Azospirillum sp.]|uniref:hypothetical protein n=1 Tax=Azospirillum sp. TaxID=34012 RepID=UPI0026384E53|nr:hypothetical protein [Azospirillum sp.]